MSHFSNLGPDVLGIVLIGAEGCSEVQNELWLRDTTVEEQKLFVEFCKQCIRQSSGDKAANSFDFADITVDGTGRPYWLKAVLNCPETPTIAREKSHKYTRVLRVHEV